MYGSAEAAARSARTTGGVRTFMTRDSTRDTLLIPPSPSDKFTPPTLLHLVRTWPASLVILRSTESIVLSGMSSLRFSQGFVEPPRAVLEELSSSITDRLRQNRHTLAATSPV